MGDQPWCVEGATHIGDVATGGVSGLPHCSPDIESRNNPEFVRLDASIALG
jgi:hypothetical protein